MDVQVVATTHRDLSERARTGHFPEDLLYRLDVVTIAVPALRIVARTFRCSRSTCGRALERGTRRASRAGRHGQADGPLLGKVRELAHSIEEIVVLGRVGEVHAVDLPAQVSNAPAAAISPSLGSAVTPVREMQRRYAVWALARLGGHKTRTAEAWASTSRRGRSGSTRIPARVA